MTTHQLLQAGEQRISIHTLRMEGDDVFNVEHLITVISIHTLRMEGDGKISRLRMPRLAISIHTLRMEGDW